MPTLFVHAPVMQQEQKLVLALKLNEAMKNEVGDRVIDIYVSDYQLVLRKGQIPEVPMLEIEMVAALVLPKDKMAKLNKTITDAAREAMAMPDLHVTVSYVRRDQDHLGVDGELLSDLYERLAATK